MGKVLFHKDLVFISSSLSPGYINSGPYAQGWKAGFEVICSFFLQQSFCERTPALVRTEPLLFWGDNHLNNDVAGADTGKLGSAVQHHNGEREKGVKELKRTKKKEVMPGKV